MAGIFLFTGEGEEVGSDHRMPCFCGLCSNGGRAVEIMGYATRVKAAIVLLVGLGLVSNFRALSSARRQLGAEVLGRDPMTLFGDRMKSITSDLPRYGVVGYISDAPDEFNEELVWTRYYLAPLVVLPDSKHHLIIGNFHEPPAATLLAERHLVLTKDYGNGIILLVNQEQ